MRNKTSIFDFIFLHSGYGHYKVTYHSPVTGKKYITVTNDMSLIDNTKNEENPTQKNLNTLKRRCKNSM